MDVSNLKGRIAEALVESIFRRAQYRVARVGRESQVQGLVRVGNSEFAPDFLVWKHVTGNGSERHLHRLLPIEVKYRFNVSEFARRELHQILSQARDEWPELYCIIVTDNPEQDRSCFQIVGVRDACADGEAPVLRDLHEFRNLEIFPTTVKEYEGLVKQIFSLLNAYGRDEGRTAPTHTEDSQSRRPSSHGPSGCVTPQAR